MRVTETKTNSCAKNWRSGLNCCKVLDSGNRPEWMILTVLPVIPPDLRPLDALEGGRFCNFGFERFVSPRHQPQQPFENVAEIENAGSNYPQRKKNVAGNAERCVDACAHQGRPVWRRQSLVEIFERHAQGQEWTFPSEQANAWITSGPFRHRDRTELKLNQCGLPKKMALVLFEPFIIRRLKELGYVHTVRSAEGVERRN